MISTLQQRQEFYNNFQIQNLKSFFNIQPQFYVIDPGIHTKIFKNPKYQKFIILKTSLKNLKQKLIYYTPEDVYYDRNIYPKPEENYKKNNFKDFINTKEFQQELAFDIDPENISCECNKNQDPYFNFCPVCLEKAKQKTLELYSLLNQEFNQIKIVYSGRGYHLHIFDKKAYSLTLQQRNLLNKKFKNFPIDPKVSNGKARLIRLPYSLNPLVNKQCLPLTIKQVKTFKPRIN